MATPKVLSQYMSRACRNHPLYGQSLQLEKLQDGFNGAVRILSNGINYDFFAGCAPFTDPETRELFDDKKRLHDTASHQILMPKTEAMPIGISQDTLIAQITASSLPYPRILKPNNESLTQGVVVLEHEEDVQHKLTESLSACTSSDHILLQEFIPAEQEFRVLCFEGDVILAYQREIAETGVSAARTPTNCHTASDPGILAQARETASCLYNEYGLVYAGLDVRIHSKTGDMYLLETNTSPRGLESLEFYLKNGKEALKELTDRMLDRMIHPAPIPCSAQNMLCAE